MSEDTPPPVLTPALTALRDGFNRRFRNKDDSSDGWIGDKAHQLVVSGHNPDDTPGVRAEYSDLDTKPEVRAIDEDADLNDPVYTMHDVIALILVTAHDLMRLRYIIYDGVIWSKSNGWRPAEYTGLDPHKSHAHFSGDPLYDENDDEWCVATMGDEMTDAQAYVQHVMNYRLEAILSMRKLVNIPLFKAPSGQIYPATTEDCPIGITIAAILDTLKAIPGAATPEQIAVAVVAEIAS